MSKQPGRNIKIGPRIDRQVWEQFKEYVEDKHGKTKGVTADEVEKALRQRMGDDPLQQIDDRLRRVEDALDVDTPPRSDDGVGERETVSNGSVSNDDTDPTTDDLTPRTQKRVDNILDNLPGRFTDDQLEAAIENVAGSSYKTLKRYKQIITRRQYAVEVPWADDDEYYQDKRMFAIAATQNLDADRVRQLEDNLEPFWGDDWFSQALPDDMPNPIDKTGDGSGRIGFQ